MATKPIWRLIDSGACEAHFNMALDEAIAKSVMQGDQPPTLRLYGWQKTSVSLGAFQRYSDIDVTYCKERDIPIVRRPTGGRAILHGIEITYSFCSKNEGIFSKGLMDSYRTISSAFIRAFSLVGIDVDRRDRKTSGRDLIKSPLCFNSISLGEISYEGKKLIGSAQRRWREGFLQQGSIPFAIDYEQYATVFKQSIDKIAEFGELSKIDEDLSISKFQEAIVMGFQDCFEVLLEHQSQSPLEWSLALRLLEEKYLQPQWVVEADSKTCRKNETSLQAPIDSYNSE